MVKVYRLRHQLLIGIVLRYRKQGVALPVRRPDDRAHAPFYRCNHGHVLGSGDTQLKITTMMAALTVAAVTSACVVVPVGPDGRAYPSAYPYASGAVVPAPYLAPVAPAPTIAVMNARLYPTNEQAQSGGMATGQVTNFLDGKGAFSVTIAGELFSGEATRSNRNAREGIANAMGSRGGVLACTYLLNNATQGSGQCTVNSGARYQLHLGG
jgi:hypothetical protein